MATSEPVTEHSYGPYVCVGFIILANLLCYLFNDNSFFGRLLWRRKGRSSFFSSSAFDHAAGAWSDARGKPREFWAFDVVDPSSVVTSHFVNGWVLLAAHTLTLSWIMVSLLVEDAKNGPVENVWVTWFTHWSLVLLSTAGGLGLVTQARHMYRCWRARKHESPCTGRDTSSSDIAAPVALVDVHGGSGGEVDAEAGGRHVGAHCNGAQVARWDVLSIAYLLTMETAVIAAFFLDVYFWVVLVGVQGDSVESPSTYLKHAANLGIAFYEVFLTRMPIASVHLQCTLAYGTLYLLFLWIYGSVSGTWRYGLNWYTSKTMVMHAVVPIALAVFMIFWFVIAVVRDVAGAALERRRAHREQEDGTYVVPLKG